MSAPVATLSSQINIQIIGHLDINSLQSIHKVSGIIIVRRQFIASDQTIATTFYEAPIRNKKEPQFVEIFIKHQSTEIKQLPSDFDIAMRSKYNELYKLLIDL